MNNNEASFINRSKAQNLPRCSGEESLDREGSSYSSSTFLKPFWITAVTMGVTSGKAVLHQYACWTLVLLKPGPVSFQTGGWDEAGTLIKRFIKGFRKTTGKEKQTVTRSKVILFYTTHFPHLPVGASQVAWFWLPAAPGTDSLYLYLDWPDSGRGGDGERLKKRPFPAVLPFLSEKGSSSEINISTAWP